MTLFLIGGASRSGKSILCRRLFEATGYPYFHLDGIFLGVQGGFPDLPRQAVKDYTYAIVPGLIKAIMKLGHSYIVEGGWLRPRTVAEFLEARPRMDIRALYLGYPEISLEEKIVQVRYHGGLERDWLARKPQDVVEAHVGQQIRGSAWFRDQCRAHGLRFCDTSRDFDGAIDGALRVLTTAGLWPNAHPNARRDAGPSVPPGLATPRADGGRPPEIGRRGCDRDAELRIGGG